MTPREAATPTSPKKARCAAQEKQGKPFGVKNADNQDTAYIINNRQGRQKNFKRIRNAVAQQREHPQRKSNNRSHRNTKSGQTRISVVKNNKNQHGDDHPTDRSTDRQHCSKAIRQFPDIEFALNLQPDE